MQINFLLNGTSGSFNRENGIFQNSNIKQPWKIVKNVNINCCITFYFRKMTTRISKTKNQFPITLHNIISLNF